MHCSSGGTAGGDGWELGQSEGMFDGGKADRTGIRRVDYSPGGEEMPGNSVEQ